MGTSEIATLTRIAAKLSAALGCLYGITVVFTGLDLFQYSSAAGFYTVFVGLVIILGTLLTLGLTLCFLALVQAQIDTRNAVMTLERIGIKQRSDTPS